MNVSFLKSFHKQMNQTSFIFVSTLFSFLSLAFFPFVEVRNT